MKKLIPILFCIITSCSKTETIIETITYFEKSYGQIIPLKYHDYQCPNQNSFAPLNINFSSLNSHINNLDYNNYVTKISENKIMGEVKAYFEIKNMQPHFVKEKMVSNYVDFKPCNLVSYDEDSYEAASLKVSHVINEASRKAGAIISDLPKPAIKVAPHFELIYDYKKSSNEISRGRQFLINNAFYSYLNDEIVFLPKGIDKDGSIPFNGLGLWDIPMTGAHEYGHLVFVHIFKKYKDFIENEQLNLCFANNEHFVDEKTQQVIANRIVKRSNALIVLNEAFSDMFAKYVLTDELNNLNGIKCFEKTREIDSPQFITGLEKKIDNNVINEFSSQIYKNFLGCTQDINFQDEHMVGAVLAHLLDSIYNELSYNKTQKLTSIINWVKKLNLNYTQFENEVPSEIIVKAIKIAIDDAIDTSSNKEAVCRVVNNKVEIQSILSVCL